MEDKEKKINNNIENGTENEVSSKSEGTSKLELIAPIVLRVAAGAIVLVLINGILFTGLAQTILKLKYAK